MILPDATVFLEVLFFGPRFFPAPFSLLLSAAALAVTEVSTVSKSTSSELVPSARFLMIVKRSSKSSTVDFVSAAEDPDPPTPPAAEASAAAAPSAPAPSSPAEVPEPEADFGKKLEDFLTLPTAVLKYS